MNQLISEMIEYENLFKTNEASQFEKLRAIVETEDSAALNFYVSMGLDINARNRRLNTIAFHLHSASMKFVQQLVYLGLNLNVINLDGDNILFGIARAERMDLFMYVLSKGVNPHETNRDGHTALKESCYWTDIPRELIMGSAMFENDFSYEDAIFDSNFELALSIAGNKIQRLGGVSQLFKVYSQIEAIEYVADYYEALLLNKMYEEAWLLQEGCMEAAVRTSDMSPRLVLFDPILPMVMNREKDVIKAIRENNLHSRWYAQQQNYFIGLVALSELTEDSYSLNEVKKYCLANIEGYSYLTAHLYDICLNENPTISLEQLESDYEEGFERIPNNELKMDLHYYLALCHLYKGDLVNAALTLNRLILFKLECKEKVVNIFGKAHVLLRYIESKLDSETNLQS